MNDTKSYSQIRAMLAVTQASLRSIFRNPSTVAFSFALPVFFILVLGFIGGGNISVKIGVAPGSDTTNMVYTIIKSIPQLKLEQSETAGEMKEELNKGKLDGILSFRKNSDSTSAGLNLLFQKSKASAEGGAVAEMIIKNIVSQANLSANPDLKKVVDLKTEEVTDKAFKRIDFILPGMLGFSLLSMGVFGTAFVFLNLRNTLVIKRFFATPIHKAYIILGEALSRVIFALMSSSLIIVLGYFVFDFTLQHGIFTFINMLVLAFLALFVFMGMGFIISGLAKSESAVPPLANMIVLPQLFLGGTFFPTSVFPAWLQPITKALPLTYLNDAMRRVAFEGVSLFSVWNDILVLGIWGIIIYFLATRLFKWE
jgi:ABC-2 type transport system permease protein